ncbi:transposase [Labrys neptuniae]|uniref:IS66-like element accessory protein TnpA n=1 Tax=Labrys TaxID=204476 RepID=UPI002891B633|nr:transposase [Labrys neptuniae]MDT3379558.1 transposase [Labrys neptuniae]
MGRVEILTGVERRRNWTDEQKLRILEEVAAGDQGIAEIARRHDVLPQQIYTWRRKLGLGSGGGRPEITLLPVAVIPQSKVGDAERPGPGGRSHPKRPAKARIEIGCRGGRVLKVEADIAPELLKVLIRAVEEA